MCVCEGWCVLVCVSWDYDSVVITDWVEELE